MRDLNDLTRPTVPSGAIQERMLAKPEERRDVVGQNCPGPVRPARLAPSHTNARNASLLW